MKPIKLPVLQNRILTWHNFLNCTLFCRWMMGFSRSLIVNLQNFIRYVGQMVRSKRIFQVNILNGYFKEYLCWGCWKSELYYISRPSAAEMRWLDVSSGMLRYDRYQSRSFEALRLQRLTHGKQSTGRLTKLPAWTRSLSARTGECTLHVFDERWLKNADVNAVSFVRNSTLYAGTDTTILLAAVQDDPRSAASRYAIVETSLSSRLTSVHGPI
jgi:hypothetical protein